MNYRNRTQHRKQFINNSNPNVNKEIIQLQKSINQIQEQFRLFQYQIATFHQDLNKQMNKNTSNQSQSEQISDKSKGKRKEHSDLESEVINMDTNTTAHSEVPTNSNSTYDVLAARQSEMENNMNSLQKMMKSISDSVSSFVKRNSFGPSDIPPNTSQYADDGDLIDFDPNQTDYQEEYYEYGDEYVNGEDDEASFDTME
jgi:chromosome segregation ATPase